MHRFKKIPFPNPPLSHIKGMLTSTRQTALKKWNKRNVYFKWDNMCFVPVIRDIPSPAVLIYPPTSNKTYVLFQGTIVINFPTGDSGFMWYHQQCLNLAMRSKKAKVWEWACMRWISRVFVLKTVWGWAWEKRRYWEGADDKMGVWLCLPHTWGVQVSPILLYK